MTPEELKSKWASEGVKILPSTVPQSPSERKSLAVLTIRVGEYEARLETSHPISLNKIKAIKAILDTP